MLIWPTVGAGFFLLCSSVHFLFVWVPLCLAAIHDLPRRDHCSPSCRIPVLHSHLYSCYDLSSPSSLWRDPLPCPTAYMLPANTLHRAVYCSCFQWLWEKISILNEQNYEDQCPSVPLTPSQHTLVLSVPGNISGSLGLRYRQCITPYLP